MPPSNYRQLADQAADRYGIPRKLFRALIKQESGWRTDARSGADAVGLTQIHLPSHPDVSRQQALDPAFNLDYGARYLAAQYKRFGKWNLALAAYNAGPGRVESGDWTGIPETTSYVKNVLAMAGDTNAPTAPTVSFDTGDPMSFPQVDMSGPMLEGLTDIASGKFDPVAQLGRAVQARRMQVDQSVAAAQTPVAAAPVSSPAPQPTQLNGDWNDWLVLPQWSHASGAAEPGQPILRFAATVAQSYGKPLSVWDTTRHSKMTTSGNVSAHWTGGALDIPATGAKLMRLGRLALMAAGMPRKQAMRAKAGLYNVGGYQIIFGTNSRALGGNHTDHVHVAIRR